MKWFALLILLVLAALVVVMAVVLGQLPGKIARKRAHPQAEAIHVAGWVGILTLGLLWPIALVLAFTNPGGRLPVTGETLKRGGERLDRLERVPVDQEEAT